jgi:MoxR-like ATPase
MSDSATGPAASTTSPAPSTTDPAAIYRQVAERVVGRHRELRLILAAVATGRDLLLEGPPGTSKSTLLREVTRAWGVPLVFVEGNAELTTSKLVGHHNPSRVLREDYSADTFVPGPLVEAMRSGGFLYVEEINRAPEDTLNALLTAIAEREISVPRAGKVVAASGFRLVASMNPFDNVGTSRISSSVHDRLCRVSIGYQDEAEEAEVVRWRTQSDDDRLVADAVAVTRATRAHPDVRQGSSVRGAIDLVLVATALGGLGSDDGPGAVPPYEDLVLDAMIVALSGRIQLDETSVATAEQILREIWEDHFVLRPRQAAPG